MITKSAIEAGAVAWDKNMGGRYAPNEVDELSEEVGVILEAALPFIKEQVLREAAFGLMDVQEHESRMPGIRFAVGFLSGVKK